MNIGVLTGMGEMYLIRTNKKLKKDEDIEEFVCKTVDESAGNLNWQVLKESRGGALNFKIVAV